MSETATLGFDVKGPSPFAGTVSISYDGAGGAPRVVLTGAQTYTVDLAMMPAEGLKGLLVLLDSLDNEGSPVTAPVMVAWTADGDDHEIEISATRTQQGFLVLASPAPDKGITALALTSTANAVVHVVALG